jgi:hypothetical protein
MTDGSRDFPMAYNSLLLVESHAQKAMGMLSKNDGPMALADLHACMRHISIAVRYLQSEYAAKLQKDGGHVG